MLTFTLITAVPWLFTLVRCLRDESSCRKPYERRKMLEFTVATQMHLGPSKQISSVPFLTFLSWVCEIFAPFQLSITFISQINTLLLSLNFLAQRMHEYSFWIKLPFEFITQFKMQWVSFPPAHANPLEFNFKYFFTFSARNSHQFVVYYAQHEGTVVCCILFLFVFKVIFKETRCVLYSHRCVFLLCTQVLNNIPSRFRTNTERRNIWVWL